MYIDVEAVHEERELALKDCSARKLRWEDGNMNGMILMRRRSGRFPDFYEEGDTEVTLKFRSCVLFWIQPYVMEIGADKIA